MYDFRRPTTLAREHSRVLELAFETFARQWGTQLTAKVRVLVQVTCEQVAMHTYDEYAASLPATTAMVLCALDGTRAEGRHPVPDRGSAGLGELDARRQRRPLACRAHLHADRARARAPPDGRRARRPALLARLAPGRTDRRRRASSTTRSSPRRRHQRADDRRPVRPARRRVRGDGDRSPSRPRSCCRSSARRTRPAASTTRRELDRRAARARPRRGRRCAWPRRCVKPSVVLGSPSATCLPLPHPQHRPLDVAVDGQPVAAAAVGANGSRLACVVVTTTRTDR